MICLWCNRELQAEEIRHGNLCFGCERVSTGIPGLASEYLDTLPFGVIQLNRKGDIISFNKAEEGLSGQDRDSVIGRNFFKEVAPCADVKDFHGRFDGFLNGDGLAEVFDYTYYFGPRAVDVQITFLRVNQQLAFVLSKRAEA